MEGTPEEVFAVLHNPVDYVRWWPSVWLHVELIDPGGPNGAGRTARVLTRGWLPYTLRWTARTIEAERPRRICVEASGDFEGTGQWTITPVGSSHADVEYVWTVTAKKSLLRYLSPLLRPLFEANHQWAMARGEESLRRELGRRAAVGQKR